jgi:outer membrane protein assembly factor BamA
MSRAAPGLALAWIAIAVIAGGCGARPAKLTADQNGVGVITLNGVKQVSDSDIMDGLGIQRAKSRGLPFARYLVSLDRRRIEGFYLRHGFLSATVESEVKERGTLRDVTFTIVEGPRAKLAAIDVIGLPPDVDPDILRRKIGLKDGAPFDYTTYDLVRPTLPQLIEAKGYARAKLTSLVIADRAKNVITIRLTVDPGPKSVFGEVTITGVERGDIKDAVEDRIGFSPGDPYSPRRIDDTREDISDLGRFALVRVEPDKSGTSPTIPIAIKLAMRQAHELRLGGGVGYNPIAYEIRGRGTYSVTGWPTVMTNTALEFRPALVRVRDENSFEPRIEAVGTLEKLDLLRAKVTGSAQASFSYLALEAYTSYGPRLHLGVRSPLYRRIVSASVGWRIQQLKFRDLDDALPADLITRLGLDATERIGTFDQALIVDLRDNAISPTKGMYAEARVEEGTSIAGSKFDYIRFVPDVRGYITGAGFTLAGRVTLGAMRGDIPATERFYGGGASSQRGFGERRLSPMAVMAEPDGNVRRVPYGGGALFGTSIEVRKQLAAFGETDDVILGGVVFLDGADVTETWGDLDFGKLHWALGVGVRVRYIVPFRLDVGYRLNRHGPDDPDPATSTWGRMALQLSVGEAF